LIKTKCINDKDHFQVEGLLLTLLIAVILYNDRFFEHFFASFLTIFVNA